MKIQNLSPLFLLLILVSPILIASIPYAYSDEPVEANISNLFTLSDVGQVNSFTHPVIYVEDVLGIEINRYFVFFCNGLSYSVISSEVGGSGRVWSNLANVSILNNGDCDTGGFQYWVNFNGTHFHTVWRENVANSTLTYASLLPNADGTVQRLRQEVVTTDGTGGALVVESGNGNLYVVSRFNAGTDDLHLYRSIDFGSTWTDISSLGDTPIQFNLLGITNMSNTRAMFTYQLGTSLHFKIFYGINASFGTRGDIQVGGIIAGSAQPEIVTDSTGRVHINLHSNQGGTFDNRYANFTGTGPDFTVLHRWASSTGSNQTSGISVNANGNGTTVFNARAVNLIFSIQNSTGSFENGTETHDAWTNDFSDTNRWGYTPIANSTGFYAMIFVNSTTTATVQQLSIHIFGISQAPPPPPPPPPPPIIPSPPNPFGVGNETTFLTMIVEDSLGNLRINYAEGETMIFDISLQFINSTTGGVQDGPVGSVINLFRFDEFFMAFTLVGSNPTIDRFNGLGPRARIPIVHIDGLQPTTEYRANFTGNFFFNITAGISNTQTIITIADAEIPLSIGTRLSPPLVDGLLGIDPNFIGPILGSDIQTQELFAHGDFFRVSTFLTRIDTGGIIAEQTVFLEIQINATGPFVRLETIITNEFGRATSQFRTWDTRFVGAQVFRFRYFATGPMMF